MSSVQKAARLGSHLLRIALRNPARIPHVLGNALWASEEVVDPTCDLLRLRQVSVNDLLPPDGPPLKMEFAAFPETHASVSLLEITCLILLLKRTAAQLVFEFGTYRGVSATQLALNLSPNGRLYTLDLPDT